MAGQRPGGAGAGRAETPMGGGGARGGCRQVRRSPGWSDRSGADAGRGAL